MWSICKIGEKLNKSRIYQLPNKINTKEKNNKWFGRDLQKVFRSFQSYVKELNLLNRQALQFSCQFIFIFRIKQKQMNLLLWTKLNIKKAHEKKTDFLAFLFANYGFSSWSFEWTLNRTKSLILIKKVFVLFSFFSAHLCMIQWCVFAFQFS